MLPQRPISAPRFSTLDRAVDALVRRQDGLGRWRDFWLPGGTSDEWITAYTGAALAQIGTTPAQRAARSAWQFLSCRAKRRDGWGYSGATPPDADSTSWALLLAQRIGADADPPAVAGARLLQEHTSRNGVATYAHVEALRRFTGIEEAAFDGWTQPHWCVGGVAAQLRGARPEVFAAMDRAQCGDGAWKSYWWRDDAYATAMCCAAFHGRRCAAGRRERAATWVLCSPAEATPFAIALRSIVLTAAAHPQATALASSLVSLQESDGLWRGTAWLRVPHPDVRHPEGASYERWWGVPAQGRTVASCNVESLDQHSIFTTATALSALAFAEREGLL